MFNLTEKEGIQIARFAKISRFTLAVTEDVKAELKPILMKKHTKMILDLEGIEFIDSSGIGCIISLIKTAKNSASVIKICNLSPNVADVFELLHLQKILDIEKDLDSSIRSFEEKK